MTLVYNFNLNPETPIDRVETKWEKPVPPIPSSEPPTKSASERAPLLALPAERFSTSTYLFWTAGSEYAFFRMYNGE